MAIPELKDAKDRLTDCIYFGDPLSASVGSGFVPTNRQMNTTAPLGGGGDLSTNRTLTISNFAGSAAGAVPTSLGGTTNFLRADGSWAAPAVFTSGANGYAPASGGGTTNYLRADGTWASPPGSGLSGLTVDFYPVATAATTAGNGRIQNITDGIRFHAAYTSAGDYKAIQTVRDNVNGLYYLQPADYDGVTTFTTGLLFAAQGSASNVQVLPEKFVVSAGLAFAQESITFANGLNSNVALPSPRLTPFLRATGPTGAFSVGGFTKTVSASPYDSEVIYVFNTTSQAMTIVNEDLSSTAAQRIWTGTGANISLPAAFGVATFFYSDIDSRWIYGGASQVSQYPRTLGYVPYQNSGGNLADSTLFHDSANNRYGFATATPKATVDVNGTLATRAYSQVLANGLNSDLPAPTTSLMRVTGPTASYSIGGIATVAGEDGKRLIIHNAVAQGLTIVNEDLSSTAAYRIKTLTGADVTLPRRTSICSLVYDGTASRWVLDTQGSLMGTTGDREVVFVSGSSLSSGSGLKTGGSGASTYLILGADIDLTRKDARHLQLGTSGPSPLAHIISSQSSVGGLDSNTRGGKLSVGGGAGTGTGGGGDTALITAYPGPIGNTQNSFADRVVLAAKPVALTGSTATTVITVGVPTETGSGGTLNYTIYATDGTDMQILRGRLPWGAVNKASAITVVLGTPEEVDCTPTGTLTVTVTALDNADDTFSFQFDAASSLTETTLETWISLEHDGKGAVTTV